MPYKQNVAAMQGLRYRQLYQFYSSVLSGSRHNCLPVWHTLYGAYALDKVIRRDSRQLQAYFLVPYALRSGSIILLLLCPVMVEIEN